MKRLLRSCLVYSSAFGAPLVRGDDPASAGAEALRATARPPIHETPAGAEPLGADAHELDAELVRTRHPNLPLLGTGSTVLTIGYAPALLGAFVSDRAGDDYMYLPVTGPFLSLAHGAGETPGQKALLTIDGAVQAIGALTIIGSFLIPEERTPRWARFGRERRLRLLPRLALHGAGLAAHGYF